MITPLAKLAPDSVLIATMEFVYIFGSVRVIEANQKPLQMGGNMKHR